MGFLVTQGRGDKGQGYVTKVRDHGEALDDSSRDIAIPLAFHLSLSFVLWDNTAELYT